MLERLAGLDSVQAIGDYFILGDRLIVNRYPLTTPDRTPETLAAYAEWALEMLGRVERLVLIDFEVATLAEQQARAALAHPGFAPPRDREGVEVDRYALACLCLGLFAPQTTMLLQLHPAKARQLADLIVEISPVPKATADAAVRTILGSTATTDDELAALPMLGRAGWPEVRDAICRAIIASATPERDDRLFPGDIAQFHPGGGYQPEPSTLSPAPVRAGSPSTTTASSARP